MDRLTVVCNLQGSPFPDCPKNCRGFFSVEKGHGCGNNSPSTTCESFRRLTLNSADGGLEIGADQIKTRVFLYAISVVSRKISQQKTKRSGEYFQFSAPAEFNELNALSRVAIPIR